MLYQGRVHDLVHALLAAQQDADRQHVVRVVYCHVAGLELHTHDWHVVDDLRRKACDVVRVHLVRRGLEGYRYTVVQPWHQEEVVK
jgi:hypothetical protein